MLLELNEARLNEDQEDLQAENNERGRVLEQALHFSFVLLGSAERFGKTLNVEAVLDSRL